MDISSGMSDAPAQAEPQRAHDEVPPIVAPGPWIAFGALALGIAFDTLHAIRLIGYMPRWMRNSVGLALVALGLWYVVRANIIFRREKTPFQPWRPTRIIAARDIYGYSRNPMYQGFIVLVLGLGVLLRSDGTMLMLLPAAMLVHYGVVLREERYLDRRFGESYRRYMAAVPRYGWPFAEWSQARSKP
jgi:protein-S-isoprenylcysteine O-methyltransferase Ste14